MKQVIRITPQDNVATLLCDLPAGATAALPNAAVAAREDIPYGHKIALSDIPEGAPIIKYGEHIAIATEYIPAGAWVHTHNCRSGRGGVRHD